MTGWQAFILWALFLECMAVGLWKLKGQCDGRAKAARDVANDNPPQG